MTNFWAYIIGSFNLGRVFLFEWTVNWRFLSEEWFVHPGFHIGLLLAHVGLLLLFGSHWFRFVILIFIKLRYRDIIYIQQYVFEIFRCMKSYVKLLPTKMNILSQLFLLPLFTANLIGVALSRSLHYQFYGILNCIPSRFLFLTHSFIYFVSLVFSQSSLSAVVHSIFNLAQV